MDTFKRRLSASHNEGDAEHGRHAGLTPADIALMQHREDDDRADEAKGRNADQMDKKYWLSVNYIGTMFAIGMAFMGGIGGSPIVTKDAKAQYTDSCARIRTRSSHPWNH